jgi:hypothetical protein
MKNEFSIVSVKSGSGVAVSTVYKRALSTFIVKYKPKKSVRITKITYMETEYDVERDDFTHTPFSVHWEE